MLYLSTFPLSDLEKSANVVCASDPNLKENLETTIKGRDPANKLGSCRCINQYRSNKRLQKRSSHVCTVF